MNKYYLLFVLFFLTTNFVVAQYSIGSSPFSYNDAARSGRQVNGTTHYPANSTGFNVPAANGEFPVIVFGHAFVTPITEYDVWINALVPQGYILVFPSTETSTSPDIVAFGLDLSFLLDTYLSENNNSSSIFYQKINGKSAVMGHSMGGGASFLAASTNTNFTAHASLAAAEAVPTATANASAINAAPSITIPSLVFAGADDCITFPANHQIPMYNALGSSYKAYIEITGGSHCKFGDNSLCYLGELNCSGTISQSSQHSQMLGASLPWFDFWLKGDCAAWPVFQNYLTTTSTHTYMDAGVQPALYPSFAYLTGLSDVSADLTWQSTGASEYYICYRSVGANTWTTLNTNSTSISLTGLTHTTDYEYIVSADCSGCEDPNATIQSFTTAVDSCPPSLDLTGNLNSGTYAAGQVLSSDAVLVNGIDVAYEAGNCIEINAGFAASLGATFSASIANCFTSEVVEEQ